MTADNVIALPHAAPAARAPRHRWGDALRLAACASVSGCDQTERTCRRCGLVCVTIHPPHHAKPWREWRKIGDVQVMVEGTPPCRED